jgi:hypothetical protein
MLKQINKERNVLRNKGNISSIFFETKKDKNGDEYKVKVPGRRSQRSRKKLWYAQSSDGQIHVGSFSYCLHWSLL